MNKIAIILHAEPGTHDSMGRALHALLYTQELFENGYEVTLIFDGGGTRWIDEFRKPENPMTQLYESLKKSGVIGGVCDYCVTAFGGEKEAIKKEKLPLISEYKGHPSLKKLLSDGYQVITL